MSSPDDPDAQAARDAELTRMMLNDLGAKRREQMRTVDYNSHDSDLRNAHDGRDSAREGTREYEKAKANQAAIKQWGSVPSNGEPDEIDIAAGQLHRSRLNSEMRPSNTGSIASSLPKHKLQNPLPAYSSSPFEHLPPHGGKVTQDAARVPVTVSQNYVPLDPAVERDSYGYSNKSRPRPATTRHRNTPSTSSTRRSPVEARHGPLHHGRLPPGQQRRRSTEGPSAEFQLRRIQQTLSEASAISKPIGRSKTTATSSYTRSGSVSSATNSSRLSVALMKGWEPEVLAGNVVASPSAISAVPSVSATNLDAARSSIVLQPKLKLSDLSTPELNPVNVSKNEDDTGRRSPKRIKTSALQPVSANVSPTNLMDTPIEETATAQAVQHFLTTSKHPQGSSNDSHTTRSLAPENVSPFYLSTIDKPNIRHDPNDPLATQARQDALSSEDSFWKWRAGKLTSSASAPTFVPLRAPLVPDVPRLPAIPEVPASSVQETSPPTHHETPTLSLIRPSPPKEDRQPVLNTASALHPASLRAPTNQSQWTSPTQTQFGISARNTSSAVNLVDDSSVPAADILSTSPTDSCGMSELTRRLDSFSLNSTIPAAVVEDTVEEEFEEDMVMLDGYPISVDTLCAKLRISRQQFKKNYNPDA